MDSAQVSVRSETASDRGAIHDLITVVFRQTFGSEGAEVALMEQLRKKSEFGPIISLVADLDGVLVGHIFFSRVRLASHPDIAVCALAPLGVDSRYQKLGIGSQLVQRGLKECVRQGYRAVFVQGSLQYYPRFGFFRIGTTNLQTIFKSDHDMVLELESGLLAKVSGRVEYPAPWSVFQ